MTASGPPDWNAGKLGDFIELKRGYDLPRRMRRDGPFPIVSSSGPSGTHIEAKVKGPGVVTGRYGTIGQVFFVEGDYWPLNTALYVRDFKGNDPRFVSYFLRSFDFHKYVDKAAVPGVNRNHLHLEEVAFPPLPEQRAIAHILGSLDDKIELNRKMNRTLEEMARALFKSWFVDFDPVRAKAEGRQPPGMDAETAALFPDGFEDSELGPIPRGWEIAAIGDVVSVKGGSTPSTRNPDYWDGGTIHWTTPKDLSSLKSPVLLDTARKITAAGLAKISSGLLPAGTLLLSSRAPVGYLAISQVPIAVNQGYIAMPPGGRVSSLWMLYWLQANMDRILARAGGTTFAEISKRNFRPISLVVPSSGLLERFDEVVGPLFQRVVANDLESRTLAALRDTLLPKLVSGEIRVPDAERFIEEVAP